MHPLFIESMARQRIDELHREAAEHRLGRSDRRSNGRDRPAAARSILRRAFAH
jgi:hypothetical protein